MARAHNNCRINQTLTRHSCDAADVSKTLWSMDDVLAMVGAKPIKSCAAVSASDPLSDIANCRAVRQRRAKTGHFSQG